MPTSLISSRTMLAVTGVVFLSACGNNDSIGDLTLPEFNTPGAYYRLEVNYRAVNLALTAPGNSVQLSATPRSFDGSAIAGVEATPTFSSLDPSTLLVTEDGLVTSKQISDQARVLVRLTIGTVTHVDTAFVRVFPSALPSPLAGFSVQPQPGDSAIWSAGLFPKSIIPVMTAENGSQIFDPLLVSYRSSNPEVATYDEASGGLSALQSGTTFISANTYAFGVFRSDSVRYTITYPSLQIVDVAERAGAGPLQRVTYFGPDTVVIGVGGMIAWRTGDPSVTRPVGIEFEKPLAAGPPLPPLDFFFPPDSGNVASIDPGQYLGAARSFSTPGVYVYHDDQGQATGYIDVRANTPANAP